MKITTLVLGLLVTFFTFSSCKRFVEIAPPNNQVISDIVFADNRTATAAVTGMYGQMNNTGSSWSAAGIHMFAGLTADELVTQIPSGDRQFEENEISAQNGTVNAFWTPVYNIIYTSNVCIEKLQASEKLSPQLKQSLLGEAYFTRAFAYFYLVNLFGNVPLALSPDYTLNATLPRASVNEVYAAIVADLKQARELLKNEYIGSDRNRPNRHAATALLARVSLYLKDWQLAASLTSEVINSATYAINPDISKVFLKSSEETIWQLAPVDPGKNTWIGYYLVPSSALSTPLYKFRKDFLNSFETKDLRYTNWVGKRVFQGDSVYYPAKYLLNRAPPVNEHNIVFRLAELYLIRAEAKAMLGQITEGRADLNAIRTRAGLPPVVTNDQQLLISAIAKERRMELFTEWGDRWFDLRRTGKISQVLSSLKPLTWKSTDTVFPIPYAQLLLNPKLKQNEGY